MNKKHRLASALVALLITASSFGALSAPAANAAPVVGGTSGGTVSTQGLDYMMCYFFPRICR
ncbi:hypothetical protein [Acidipropionibacterium acidipropionici]|uniref:hypothetical protein n=1 Tax=Acidipropionibacterium acidipropionici TaxID=1748 RepID=UPI00110B1142|nr:hypothetical protein [Acidipropionibacterium acidipropionici]QCV95512.1 hypothetical protein FEZ30_09780 [Acidipropionibacterium acidipropionici]